MRGRIASLEADSEAGRLLRSREPILWSADVPLYEDALHDHGAVALRARIRAVFSAGMDLDVVVKVHRERGRRRDDCVVAIVQELDDKK